MGITSKPKSPQILKRTQNNFHDDCRDVFISPRHLEDMNKSPHKTVKPFAPSSKTINYNKSQSPHLSRPKSALKVNQNELVINENKFKILDKYQHVFPQINFSKILFSPVHMSKVFLMRKIEYFYDKQFEAILRSKTMTVVNLAKVIYETLYNKYKDSPNYYTQNLANLIYTADLYGSHSEVALFLKLLTAQPASLEVAFFIYIRQNFKIVTSTHFLNGKGQEINPLKLILTKEQAIDVVIHALYFDQDYQEQAVKLTHEEMCNKKIIGYYEFLLLILKMDINYRVILLGVGSHITFSCFV